MRKLKLKGSNTPTLLSGLFVLFFLAMSLPSSAQIAAIDFRSVPEENIAEFVERETTYWAERAKEAVNEGRLISWRLWRRVGGMNMDENSYNFVIVNLFADKVALDKMYAAYTAAMASPSQAAKENDTHQLSKSVSSFVMQGRAFAEGSKTGKFVRVNFAKVSDMEKYLAFETKTWKPFIEDLMKKKKVSCVGWDIATLLSPGGTTVPFNAISSDHFDTLGEAIQPTVPEGIKGPDFSGYAETNERVMIQTLALVKEVTK